MARTVISFPPAHKAKAPSPKLQYMKSLSISQSKDALILFFLCFV